MPTAPLSLMPALRRVIAGRAADRSDADLLAAFVDDRDPEAFAALVRRHGPMVLGVCRRVVRDPDAADDAFQAVFLVLARRAAEVRPRNRVGGWLYGVAYRTALKARAVRARRRTRESQVDAMPEPAAPPAADGWDDLKPVLDEELARLPDRLRVPVVLCDLEGRPQRAVAGQLGIAPATLAGRLADARRTLAARLTRRGVALSAAALGALLAERGATAAVAPGLAAGVVRAAEAVAAGGAAAGLVSANALQLCDGVMRMIFLTKLKTAAATAVAVLILAGGVGPGLVTVRAQDGREAAPPAAKAGAKAQSDAAFLDRVCLEFRGSKGTPVEHAYFAADADAGKRHKVMNWLLADPAVKAHLDGGASATAVTWLDELYDLGPSGITDLKEITLSADTQFLRVVTDTTTQIIPVPPAPPAADGAKATTLYRRAAVAADTTVQARTVTESVRAAKTSSVAGSVRAAKTSSATGAARVVETVDGTGTRVEVVLEAVQPPGEAKKTAPAPGEPVRVRVVRVIDDGKGNKTVVTEDERGFKVVGPATGAKKIDGGPQGDKLLYDFFYTQPDTGKKTDGKGPAPKVTVWLAEPVPGGKAGASDRVVTWATVAGTPDSDAAFLRRAVTEARGTPPTAIEERYFAADADPKKREKLLDALLADPAAARRVGEAWKQRMLAPAVRSQLLVAPVPTPPGGATNPANPNLYGVPKSGANVPYLNVQPKIDPAALLFYYHSQDAVPVPKGGNPPVLKVVPLPAPPIPPIPPAAVVPPGATAGAVRLTAAAPAADRWQRLVGELIAVGKTDEQVLEALTLAAAGRLPTDIEKRLTLATIPAAGDRAAAWAAVARALAGPTPPAPPPVPKAK